MLPLLLCAGNDATLMPSFHLAQECVSESIKACTDVLNLTYYVGLGNVKKQEKMPLFRLDACFMQTVACAGKSAACLDGDILQLRLSLKVKSSSFQFEPRPERSVDSRPAPSLLPLQDAGSLPQPLHTVSIRLKPLSLVGKTSLATVPPCPANVLKPYYSD